MSRRLLLLAMLACALQASQGCMHQDQDLHASMVAQELAMMPRDTQTRTVLNSAPPKSDAKQVPPGKGPQDKLLHLPQGLPGANATPIVVPPLDPKKPQDPERDKAIQALYPAMPTLEDIAQPAPGPNGMPLDLSGLEQIALANNPLVQQAASDVQAARGRAIQAGLYPNPVMGFQGDSIGQAGTNGQLGGFIDQNFVTGGKLGLARGAGVMDYQSAELSLRRMQIDVMTQVRSGYFAVLVAYDNLTIAKAMSQLSDEVYGLQIKMVQGGVSAPYEPLQLRVLADQARANLIQARNRYTSAWRQLAASLSAPDMPPTQLAGHAEAIAPGYAYDVVRAHILANHTDIGIASNGIQKSRILLQLARVTPVPDILTHFVVQNDNTSQPNRVQAGVQVGFQIPIWDANQGNILQAQAQLARSNQEIPRVENELMQRLADAYERYRNNITLASYYRDSVLPNQVRVYRAIYQRYQQQPDKVQYGDIVVAQQTLAQALQTYVQTLTAQWQAIVDLGALLQTDDLYQLTAPPSNPKEPAPTPVAALLDSRNWATAEAPRLQILAAPPTSPAATPWPVQQATPQSLPVMAPPAQKVQPTATAPRANTPPTQLPPAAELPPPAPPLPTRATLAAPIAVGAADSR